MKKKVCSLLLALVMLLSLVPLAAIADEEENLDPKSGEFCVAYDNRDGAQVKLGTLAIANRWSEENTRTEKFVDFSANTKLIFTLVLPEGVKELYRAEINVFAEPEKHFQYTVGAGDNTITVADNTLSFTPETNDPFEVIIYWTEEDFYYSFGYYDVEEFQVETNVSGKGSISFSPEADRGSVQFGNLTKSNFAKGGLPLTVTFTPGEDAAINSIAIGAQVYSAEDLSDDPLPTGFAKGEGTAYTYTVTDADFDENGFLYIEANFSGDELTDGQYRLLYSDAGSVTGIQAETVQEFITEQQITWAMTYPEGIDTLYAVEINVSGDPGDYFSYFADRDENNDGITVDDGKKEVSFTPTTNAPFEVIIYWTEEDYFNSFGYYDVEEFRVQTNIIGNGSVSYSVGLESEYVGGRFTFDKQEKINFLADVLPLTVTFTPDNGAELEGLVIGEDEKPLDQLDEDSGVYSYTITEEDVKDGDRYKEIYFEIIFSGEDEPGEDDPGSDRPHYENVYEALTDALENYVFAYGYSAETIAADTDEARVNDIKASLASELSKHRIGEEYIFRDDFKIQDDKYAVGEVLGKDADALALLITISNETSTEDSIIKELPYYTYTIYAADADSSKDGNQTFAAHGKVYVLNSRQDIVLKTTYTDPESPNMPMPTTSYTIVHTNDPTVDNADKDIFVSVPFDVDEGGRAAVEGYGNGVYFRPSSTEDEDIFTAHVTSGNSGEHFFMQGNQAGDRIEWINTRVIVSRAPNAIQIRSDDSAAAWDFVNAGVYNGEGGTENAPRTATIFFGADHITIKPVLGGKTISKVTAVDLPAGAVSFDASTGTLTFNTNYDSIKLQIAYEDSTSTYMLLNRVGLSIGTKEVSDGSFTVDHGTDHFVKYDINENFGDPDAEIAVYGSFYFDCSYQVKKTGDKWFIYQIDGTKVDDDIHFAENADGYGYETKADAVNAIYNYLTKVNLFVTITYENGTQRVTVTDPLAGVVVNNDGTIHEASNNDDISNRIFHYSEQGSNHINDDFLLWNGSRDDFNTIKSISAIVYEAGSSGSFGGVQVGSGAGVIWNNPDHH